MLIDIHASILLLPFVFAYSGNRTVTPKNSPDKNVLSTRARSLRHVKIPTSSEFPTSEPPETSSNDPDLPNLLYELKEKLSKTRKKALPVSSSLGGNNINRSDLANNIQTVSKLRVYRDIDESAIGSTGGDPDTTDEGESTTIDPTDLEARLQWLRERNATLDAEYHRIYEITWKHRVHPPSLNLLQRQLSNENTRKEAIEKTLRDLADLKSNGTTVIEKAEQEAAEAEMEVMYAKGNETEMMENITRLINEFDPNMNTSDEVIGMKKDLNSIVINTETKNKRLNVTYNGLANAFDDNSMADKDNLTQQMNENSVLINASKERLQKIEEIERVESAIMSLDIETKNHTAIQYRTRAEELRTKEPIVDELMGNATITLNKTEEEIQRIQLEINEIHAVPGLVMRSTVINNELTDIAKAIMELEMEIEERERRKNAPEEEGLAAGWIVLIVIVGVVLLLITACGVALGWYLCKEHLRKKRDEKEVRRLMLRAPTKSEMEYLKAHPKSVSIKSGQTDLSAAATNESKDSPGAGAGAKGSSKEKTQENSKDSANENSNTGKEASANETTPSPAQPAAQNAESPRKSAKERDSKIAPVSV